MDLGTTLILVGCFLLLEAFFSGCEIGMIAINRFKMEQLAAEGRGSAKIILSLLNKPEKLFTATSLGTNLAVVSSTAVFTGYMVAQIGENGDFVSMMILWPIILFAGEIVPKLIFQNRADNIMPVLIYPLNFTCKVFAPVISLFTSIYAVITRILFGSTEKLGMPALSRDHIRHISHPSFETSELDVDEKKMISKIFHFGELSAEQCMVPLVHVFGISDTSTLKEANTIANESGYSRLPVFHDRMFNLIGILNTFDLLNAPYDDSPITDLIRPAYYVPPNKKQDDLLKELQQRGLHMAIVVDEYGGCTGIVTIEDLLEQIVGEIEDEYDRPEKGYEPYDDGYLIDGDSEINVLNEELELDLPEGDYDTVAGLMISQLEKIPTAGEQVTAQGFRLTVKEASKRQVNSIILRKVSAEEAPETEESPIPKPPPAGDIAEEKAEEPTEPSSSNPSSASSSP